MGDSKYTIGVDFGTESGRAVLVETKTGRGENNVIKILKQIRDTVG